MYFSALFNLDNLDEEADYAVFDDIQGGFEYFPSYKSWLGGQDEFTCTDKYKHKRNVKWGKPTIWCCNYNPRTASGVDLDWLEGNVSIVYVAEDEPIAWFP